MENRETPGGKTVRLSLEARIKDFYKASDMAKVNEVLDYYPHNKLRPEITLEQAMQIGSVVELPEAA